MNWAKIAEIALTCITSVGGIGAIIVWVIKSVSDTIADRLSKKYQLQLDKEKEKYRTELSKKEYVSKTRFDTEFAIYRELTAAFSQLITDISILIPSGYVEVPADEKERQEADQKHYTEANNSAVKAQSALYSNEAFIPKQFCDAYQEFLKLSRLQLFAYTRRFNVTYHGEDKTHFTSEEYKRTREIQQKWDEFVQTIRDYLSSLDVID